MPGGECAVWYHSPAATQRMAGPSFVRMGLYAVGMLLPPSELFALCEAAPKLFARAARCERKLAPLWPLPWLSDHYLLLLRFDSR